MIKRRDDKHFSIRKICSQYFNKTLDIWNDQVPPEFKGKVNNGSCLQQVCSHLIVHCINCKIILLCFFNMLYDMLNEFFNVKDFPHMILNYRVQDEMSGFDT